MDRREHRRQRLQELIDSVAHGKVAEFAKLVDKDQSYISRMLYPADKNQAKPIGEKVISDICNALNIPSSWFDKDEPLPKIRPSSEYQIEFLTEVEASAGYGVVGGDTYNAVELIQFTEEQYTKLFSNTRPEHIKMINVSGDSMSPTFESGDLLYVDTRVNQYDGDGIYIFIYSGYRHVKRLQMAGSKLLVLSDNKTYKEWEIDRSNEDEFYIVGKVMVSQSQAIKRFG
ncbi:helix-turn-helix transcriptional regulator [Pasteurellaceae bacterium HPA106]|uniref:S24 family peptidase n=1 Tax=Spirabiliibacterium pneumoniae TaxID=221400 RepID=UPI001AAC967D|nr:helix-turn-helix transcriptional regulator [Spirabiliibacterium pneumoniae]MBE2895733.1 helix-turn-helix transcriptional regulator [Spirabiliibacterium pneumoniae]